MVAANPLGYLLSLAEELASQAKRVRDLIGSRHWLSDGHHKEYLLSNLLQRHCPSATLVTRGFVLNPRYPELCSREQDILVIDTSSEAPLFYQGGLAIASPQSLIATISVKTRLGKAELSDAVGSLSSAQEVALESGIPLTHTFYGAYFFEISPQVISSPAIIYDYLSEHCGKQSSSTILTPDYLSSGKDLIFKVSHEDSATFINGFSSPGFATAIFLAALLAHIAASRGNHESNILDLAENTAVSPLNPPRIQLPLPDLSCVEKADEPPNAKRI